MGCIPNVGSTTASLWKPRHERGKAGMDSMRKASGPLWDTFMHWMHSCLMSPFAPNIAQMPHIVNVSLENSGTVEAIQHNQELYLCAPRWLHVSMFTSATNRSKAFSEQGWLNEHDLEGLVWLLVYVEIVDYLTVV